VQAGVARTVAALSPPRIDLGAAGTRVTADLVLAGKRLPLAWEIQGASVGPTAESLLAAGLLLAMRRGEPLAVPDPVSPRLLEGVTRVQEIFHVWDRRFQVVRVEAMATGGRPRWPSPRGVACFFSGGVDSFYTALKHAERIDALVFCEGWDPPLADPARCARAGAAVGAAAAALGKPLIRVVTNLAVVSEPIVRWRYYHGPVLASIALLLAPGFHRVLLPASHSYADLHPLGSHPLVDPLWSTEDTELVHDGCEATRSERVARIARNPTALRWLRVCWEGPDGAQNCGRCEKCVRTMIALRLAGALERCPTFARPLDLDAVARLRLGTLDERAYAEDNLRAAEADGRERALAAALRACLARARGA
jgi:hypothetical protein